VHDDPLICQPRLSDICSSVLSMTYFNHACRGLSSR
jgi:hypothetical protein